jgi:microcystin-dependent protein
MSYISKYTGNEIDNLLSQIDSGNAGFHYKQLNDHLITPTTTETYTLNDSITNYDLLIINSGFYTEGGSGVNSHSFDDSMVLIVDAITPDMAYGLFRCGGSYDSWRTEAHIQFNTNTEFSCPYVNYGSNISKTGTYGISRIYGIKFNKAASTAGDSAPVGNIISFMGTKAPNGYLVCDGTELEISKYAKLAAHFEEQFGTKNHFGGNGTTTFAVPDLRNEFLRGYHNGKDEQLSGNVGEHQGATEIPNFYLDNVANNLAVKNKSGSTGETISQNIDYKVAGCGEIRYTGLNNRGSVQEYSHIAVRPTNVAVLYCIKY